MIVQYMVQVKSKITQAKVESEVEGKGRRGGWDKVGMTVLTRNGKT